MDRKRCRTWAVQEDNGGRVFPGGTNSTQLQLSHSSHDSLEISRQQELSFSASSLLSRSILPKLLDMKHCLDFFFTQNIISCIIRKKKGNERLNFFFKKKYEFKEFKQEHFNLSCPFLFFFFQSKMAIKFSTQSSKTEVVFFVVLNILCKGVFSCHSCWFGSQDLGSSKSPIKQTYK